MICTSSFTLEANTYTSSIATQLVNKVNRIRLGTTAFCSNQEYQLGDHKCSENWLGSKNVESWCHQPHKLPDLAENCGRVVMPSRHLRCNLRLFTFSWVPNLILLTLIRIGIRFFISCYDTTELITLLMCERCFTMPGMSRQGWRTRLDLVAAKPLILARGTAYRV